MVHLAKRYYLGMVHLAKRYHLSMVHLAKRYHLKEKCTMVSMVHFMKGTKLCLKGTKVKQQRGCVISHIQYALKGQKHLAQGIALGFRTSTKSRPERAKALILKAFALSGRLCFLPTLPRAMPWARSFWAFSPSSAAII